jgi:hypothetical protein
LVISWCISSSHGVAYELNLRAHAVKGNRFVLEGGYFNFEKISPILKTYEIEELKDNFFAYRVGAKQKNG